ncbi:hypothetical protein [Nocardia seriolae]|uniref:Serine/threonine protein kinase n=1 Tax=Nocardia seriolae TaxID=37332 RepID=A0A0B8N8T6_9NOCA|nr:hypothetical protein [Nocardia seriolae]APA94835.1 hypothetical protein NS506_00756 [Nocardia seriolae]MTJ60128.1 hypothetical protein [Nocardia seriolae]MTJ76258.1 hypothetical protein [Nocardia seriolae]MTJ85127.1 hypothetical protein [Nocardia seriolae]MTK29121.1 hypothetical protein [Nocardia seriolae]
MLETVLLSTSTFLGGTGASAFFTWLKVRRRQPAESLRHEVAAAKDVNDIAIKTLSRVSQELREVTGRLDAVEAAQEASIRELTRVTGLFREALGVLRGVIEAAQHGRIPELHMSRELMDEVEFNGSIT